MFGWLLLGLIPMAGLQLWVHEWAHALVAYLVEYQVLEVRLGTGHLIKRFRLGRMQCLIYAAPFGGWCSSVPISPFHSKWRKALIVLAGPVADVGLLIVLWFGVEPLFRFLGFRGSDLSDAVALYFLTMSYICLSTWYPRHANLYGQRIKTDTLKLWELFRSGPEQFSVGDMYFSEELSMLCCQSLQKGRKWQAGRLFVAAKKNGLLPDTPRFWWEMVVVLYHTGLGRQCYETSRLLMKRTDPRSDFYAGAVDTAVCCAIQLNLRQHWEDCRAALEAALILHPRKLTLRGSLGALLAEMGNERGAREILEDVLARSEAPNDKAIAAVYLAWMDFQKGEFERARFYRGEALKYYPDHRWVKIKLGQVTIPE